MQKNITNSINLTQLKQKFKKQLLKKLPSYSHILNGQRFDYTLESFLPHIFKHTDKTHNFLGSKLQNERLQI